MPLFSDDLLKARDKLKAAETESEIQSENDRSLKRNRKRNRRYISSSSDDENEAESGKPHTFVKKLPVPPPKDRNCVTEGNDCETSSLAVAERVPGYYLF